MKHWSDYLESGDDSESKEEETKEKEKVVTKSAKKEKKENNPYSFKHWRDLLDSGPDNGDEDQISNNSEEDDDEEEDDVLLNVLNYGNMNDESDTDNDESVKSGRMMGPPFEKVKKQKEKYMNRIAAGTKEESGPLYKPQNDGWREDIDLGIFDTGMTTILSPRYDFKDDMEQHYEHDCGKGELINDQEIQSLDKGGDTSNTEQHGETEITYNQSCIGQLEADLEETRSDFKLIVHYLREIDEKFCSYHEDVPVSHKSIASFRDIA